jgi:hypothetical protein
VKNEIKVYEDKTLNDQSFVLDDVVFIRCQMKNCDLFYFGGDFEWVETAMENCRFHWRGPAKNTFAMLAGMGLLKPLTTAQPSVPSTAGKPN